MTGSKAVLASCVIFSLLFVLADVLEVRAGSVFVARLSSPGQVTQYDSVTGSLLQSFDGLNTPVGTTIGPDGNLYVADQTRLQNDFAEVTKIDLSTGQMRAFATEGIRGIFGLAFSPGGELFASSTHISSPAKVVRYDGAAGGLVGTFIPGPVESPAPGGLAFGPNGNLFVGEAGEVREYDGSSGAFVRVFASGAPLYAPNALLFAPNGSLLVADSGGGLLEYDGDTGLFRRFIDSSGRFSGVALDPQGTLFAGELDSHQIRYYDWPAGTSARVLVQLDDFPEGIAFSASRVVGQCHVGDCDGNGSVTVNDIVTLVNISLGDVSPWVCPDVASGAPTDIALKLKAVNNALYRCAGGSPGPVCATVNQGETLTLRCPSGVITGIDFASYGTAQGACGAFSPGACDAPGAEAIFAEACIGFAACSVTASNGVFEDPCPGVQKRLVVQAECTSSSITPTPNPSPTPRPLIPGDIVVLEQDPAALIQIDPVTGTQALFASDGLLSSQIGENPNGFVLDRSTGSFLVVDRAGNLIRINATNGAQSLLAYGLGDPTGIAVESPGRLLITENGGSVLRFNVPSRTVSGLASGGLIGEVHPWAVEVAADGSIFVSSLAAGNDVPGPPSRFMRIDPASGAQSLIAEITDAHFRDFALTPTDAFVAISSRGQPSGQDAVAKLNLATGQLTPLVTGLQRVLDVDVDAQGRLVILDQCLTLSPCAGSPVVYRWTAAGGLEVVSTNGYLYVPGRLVIVP